MCTEFKLFDFLNGADFSNKSPDIMNLLIINTVIRKSIGDHVIKKGIFDWDKLHLFDKRELDLIKSIGLKTAVNYTQIIQIVPNLTCIRICEFFHGSTIDHMIPPNLQRLEFKRFDQHVTKRMDYQGRRTCKITKLPNTLTHLDLGDILNCSLENILPQSLEHLDLGYNYKFPLPGLPNNLKYFKYNSDYIGTQIDSFPSSLTHLDLKNYYNTDKLGLTLFSSNLLSLNLSGYY